MKWGEKRRFHTLRCQEEHALCQIKLKFVPFKKLACKLIGKDRLHLWVPIIYNWSHYGYLKKISVYFFLFPYSICADCYARIMNELNVENFLAFQWYNKNYQYICITSWKIIFSKVLHQFHFKKFHINAFWMNGWKMQKPLNDSHTQAQASTTTWAATSRCGSIQYL